jgi:hypothetical protein
LSSDAPGFSRLEQPSTKRRVMSILRWFCYPIFVMATILYAPMSLSARVIDVRCNGNAAADTNRLTHSIASSKDGDLIRIHGACEVNQTIVLFANRTYEGNSRTGSIIRQADNTNLPAVVASDSWANDTPTTGSPIRIAHIKIDGNKANNTGTHGLLIRSWLTVIEDVQIQNAPGDGILLTNRTRNGVTLTTGICLIPGSPIQDSLASTSRMLPAGRSSAIISTACGSTRCMPTAAMGQRSRTITSKISAETAAPAALGMVSDVRCRARWAA